MSNVSIISDVCVSDECVCPCSLSSRFAVFSTGSGQYEDEELDRPAPSVGSIWFSIVYDAAVQKLVVTLIKAKNLVGKFSQGICLID